MMSTEIPDSVIQWHRERKKGMLHFMLLIGSVWFLLLGLFYFGIFMTIGLKTRSQSTIGWPVVIGIWPASCVLIGFLGWHIKEAKYRRYKDAFEEA